MNETSINNQGRTERAMTYMPVLTGVRAVAAFMVYFHHFNPFASYSDHGGVLNWCYKLCDQMHIGVTIFFVLSGFLICFRYLNKVEEINLKWFYVYMRNRIARIYPMYIIITTITFILLSCDNTLDFMGQYDHFSTFERLIIYMMNITFVKGFFNGLKFTGIAQGWSLTVEECFYLFSPFILLVIRKKTSNVIYVVSLIISIGFLLVWLFRDNSLYGFFDEYTFMANFTFFGRVTEFACGILLGVFMLQGNTINYKILTYSAILCIFFTMHVMSLYGVADISKNTVEGIALNNVLLPIVICVFFYGLLTENTKLGSILSTKLFDNLGKSSYVFYLIHMGVFSVLMRRFIIDNYLICFVLINVFSIMLYYFVEKPIHELIRPKKQV